MSLIKLWHKKNGSHQTKKYLLPLFTALCTAALVFTGCANSADSIDSSDGKKEKFTITVKTQNLTSKKEDAGRSIFPVLSGSENYTLSYKSGENADWQNLDGTFPDYQMFIIPGTYTLKLDAYSDSGKQNHILTGQTELTVTSGMENAEVLFIVQPPENATGTGSVSLKLSAASDTNISYFTVVAKKPDNTTISNIEWKIEPGSTDTTGLIQGTNIPSGSYNLTITGIANNKSVYIRNETLTVWKDLTSSLWIFADGSSSNELKITASDLYSTFYVKGSTGPYNFYTSDGIGDITASDSNSGNITSPLSTISTAIAKCTVANKPYTINIDGTFETDTTIDILEDMNITINALGTPQNTDTTDDTRPVIKCNISGGSGIMASNNTVLSMNNIVIDGLNAESSTKASAIGISSSAGSKLNLSFCTVKNFAERGIVPSGEISLTNCSIIDNATSANGGGIYINDSSAIVTLTDCTFSGNEAQNGGGIYLNNGALTISSTTMESNTATAESTDPSAGVGGGAIYSTKSITLTDCTFSDNSASKGKAIRFKPMNSDQKLKFNGKIQTNEDDIYFNNGRYFVIQTPLSPDSSILVTQYPPTTGQTIVEGEEGVTLAEQVDYFKVTPNVTGTQYGVNFNGKLYEFKKIEELTYSPSNYTLVSISDANGFNTVINWLNANKTLVNITLLLENDLSLAIQIPSNFAGTINGKGHTITGTNPSYTTLFASPTANFINLKVDGSYTSVKPES